MGACSLLHRSFRHMHFRHHLTFQVYVQTPRAEAKDILFDNDSRRRMQDGINKLADAVGSTLGPRGEPLWFREQQASRQADSATEQSPQRQRQPQLTQLA